MAKVKCPYCGVYFSREFEEYYYHEKSKRYYHVNCYKKYEAERAHVDNLNEYIIKLFKLKATGPRINSQIKKYIEELGFSHLGILNSLKYFFDERGNSIDKANGGIGIVPYVYEEANNFYRVKNAMQAGIEKTVNEYKISKDYQKTILVDREDLKVKKRKKNEIHIEDL